MKLRGGECEIMMVVLLGLDKRDKNSGELNNFICLLLFKK